MAGRAAMSEDVEERVMVERENVGSVSVRRGGDKIGLDFKSEEGKTRRYRRHREIE